MVGRRMPDIESDGSASTSCSGRQVVLVTAAPVELERSRHRARRRQAPGATRRSADPSRWLRRVGERTDAERSRTGCGYRPLEPSEVAQPHVNPGQRGAQYRHDDAVAGEPPEADRGGPRVRDADGDDVGAGRDRGAVTEKRRRARTPTTAPAGLGVRRLRRPCPRRRAIVAVYGMLSTNAPSTADPNSNPVAARKKSSPNIATAASPSDPMTPVCTSPATIANRPMKNTSVGHSTSGSTSATSTLVTSSIVPAPSERDDRRGHMQHRVQAEPDDDECRAPPATARAAGVLDGSPFLQGHHVVEAAWLCAEAFRNSTLVNSTNSDEDDHDRRVPC